MARLFQRVPAALLLPVARFVERRFPGRKAGSLGEFGATVRTHARRVLMGDVPRYAAQFGHFTPEQMAELCSPELQAAGADAGRALFGRLLSEATATDALGRLLELDTQTYLVDDIFTKVDIASMQSSLEVRCPLVDHVLIEFAATVPSDLKMRASAASGCFARRCAISLPHNILYRQKRGFGIPHARWLRGELRPLLHDTLLSRRVYERGQLQRARRRAPDRGARHGPREPRPAPVEPAVARAVAPDVHRRADVHRDRHRRLSGPRRARYGRQ